MPVYSPAQASVTAKQEPFEAGGYPPRAYFSGLGDAGTTPNRTPLYVAGVVLLFGVGIIAFAARGGSRRGVAGVGKLDLKRSIPAP